MISVTRFSYFFVSVVPSSQNYGQDPMILFFFSIIKNIRFTQRICVQITESRQQKNIFEYFLEKKKQQQNASRNFLKFLFSSLDFSFNFFPSFFAFSFISNFFSRALFFFPFFGCDIYRFLNYVFLYLLTEILGFLYSPIYKKFAFRNDKIILK